MTWALTVIGVPCSVGAHHGGLERGPAALRAAGLPDRLCRAGWEVSDAGDLTRRVFTADAAHPRARNRDAVLLACRPVTGHKATLPMDGQHDAFRGSFYRTADGAAAGGIQQPIPGMFGWLADDL
jgi:arginase